MNTENKTNEMATKADSKIETVSFVSLGCPKNLVDSEKMLGLLAEDGLLPVDSDEPADAVVVNTCGFLEAAKDESIGEINQAVALKEEGLVKRVVVAGCLVQRQRAKLLEWCPGIDAMIGVFDRDRIIEAVKGPTGFEIGNDIAVELPVYSSIAANAVIAKQHREMGDEVTGYFEEDGGRMRLTARHYAYLRISEGCNQNCAFCTIPSIRGKMRSKPVDRIVGEARELMNDGAFELNLIGQDTTSFGDDIGYEAGLVGMLEGLNGVVKEYGGGWVRLMYAYPSKFTDEMVEAIARLEHVVKYIDIPLQHINDGVLDRMRRYTSRECIETLLRKLKERVPGIAIRTTFISGFPGETEEQHQELVEFVRGFGFENMGVFGYSPEPGTVAGTMYGKGDAVDDETIARRIDELMMTQQTVVFERHDAMVANEDEVDVLIDAKTDSVLEGEDGDVAGVLYQGRTSRQAPQVDGVTYVHSESGQEYALGEIVKCRVIGYDGYDLIAKPVRELEKRVSLPLA
ncbi:Ribosomal protein S12 methylthiotransferase RimO [Poriferisphaera corsica]|uniref:Ribosomal protein uS12 methylthiotransferase RimO n=2 Tax=Poriferisphaera corsica TaxID=2528020 RepID=A0A517YWB9_9BACT|nr:Ribosomal protein S12 methylthiotransferase RimO [Poriferisphaera corsica]